MKTTKNGNEYSILSLATQASWKDKKSCEYVSRTEWHRMIVWQSIDVRRDSETSPAAAGTEISSISSDASTEGQESGSFCPNLRTIVKAGGSGFRSIKGTRDAPDVAPNLWNSTVSVIDKTGCMGDDDGDSGTTVTCYGEGSSDELKSQYEKLVSSTRRCLSNWPEHKSSNFDGDNRMEFSGPNNVKVRVELWEKKDGNLSLSLEVAQEK